MKKLKALVLLISMLFTTIAYAENNTQTQNYETYRKQVDSEIAKLGYTQLRIKLSNIIHNMDEPWDLIQYKQCLAKEIELNSEKGFDRKNKKNCKALTIELPSDRFTRLELIVDGIVLELNNAQDKYGRKWFWSNHDLALVTLNKMFNESQRFSLEVQKGWKRGDKGRSFCLAQVWSRPGDKYFRWDMVGYDSNKLTWSLNKIRACSYMSFQHLTYHTYRCVAHEKSPNKGKQQNYNRYIISSAYIAQVYAGYGTGHTCNPWHLRPKLKDGKKVVGTDGKSVMVHGYEPMRRAKQFWTLKIENKI